MKNKILSQNINNFIKLETNERQNTVRIIFDYNSGKLNTQYKLLYNILPKHDLFIYQNEEHVSLSDTTYNIYFDTINEFCYYNLKTKYTILFVNDGYVSYKYSQYLRREQYNKKPLIKLNTIVDFYFCFTKYSVNKLLNKWKIPLHKIIYLTNIFNITPTTFIQKSRIKQKYILFDIDCYENSNNLAVLECWLKYFYNSKTILVIYVNRPKRNDKIMEKITLLSGKIIYHEPFVKHYHNIIITNIYNVLDFNYYAIILNVSKYNLFYKVYKYILLKKIVIVNNNSITREIFNNKMFLYSDINKININLDLLINSSIENINDIPNYLHIKRSNIKKIFTHFIPNTDKYVIPKFNFPFTPQCSHDEYRDSHNKIIPLIVKIDNDFKKQEQSRDINHYFTFIKRPIKKTKFCYATFIINNSCLASCLVSGYRLKEISNYNVICFVHNLNTFEIKQIKKIYDCVISIDTQEHGYSFATLLVFSFTYYKKIYYYNENTLIYLNIDSVFENNKISFSSLPDTLPNIFNSAHYIIIPKKYYISKFIYIITHFDDIFTKNNFKFKFNINHYLLCYSIYPNFGLFNNIKQFSGIDIDRYNDNYIKINNYSIINYPFKNPFKYSSGFYEIERCLFLLNYTHYLPWDSIVQELIQKYPMFKKIFRYIKTFRFCFYRNKKYLI
jgi:hypothetical protein